MPHLPNGKFYSYESVAECMLWSGKDLKEVDKWLKEMLKKEQDEIKSKTSNRDRKRN